MTRSISVRISADLHAVLKAWAKSLNIPVAVLVRDVLWKNLEVEPSQERSAPVQP